MLGGQGQMQKTGITPAEPQQKPNQPCRLLASAAKSITWPLRPGAPQRGQGEVRELECENRDEFVLCTCYRENPDLSCCAPELYKRRIAGSLWRLRFLFFIARDVMYTSVFYGSSFRKISSELLVLKATRWASPTGTLFITALFFFLPFLQQSRYKFRRS